MPERSQEAVEAADLERGAQAFWGWFREQLTDEECEAIENAGVHPTDWRAAAECCIRAARGERDHRPFSTYPDLPEPPPLTVAAAVDPCVPVRVLREWIDSNDGHECAPDDPFMRGVASMLRQLAALLDEHANERTDT
jgi:hypothetical protein